MRDTSLSFVLIMHMTCHASSILYRSLWWAMQKEDSSMVDVRPTGHLHLFSSQAEPEVLANVG